LTPSTPLTSSAPGPDHVALSVDMDTPADYASFYGWGEARPAADFLAESVPPLLDLLAEHDARATFFCIGREAADPGSRPWLRRIADAGHEIANHTHTHPPAFSTLGRAAKARQIGDAHEALADAVGRAPVGFRAPAYDLDRDTLEILAERGYRYDSSLLPSPFLIPMKMVVRWRARRWKVGLGGWRQGFRSRRPRVHRVAHRESAKPGELVELPLSVLPWVPGLRLPVYSTITQFLGMRTLRASLALLRRGRWPIHYSLHAQEMAPAPGPVPGYGDAPDRRVAVLRESLAELARDARFVTLEELARLVATDP
jgi:peptidoglycan/xylan/chitin deacetylase (PgdA/CDA1 family)